MTQLPEIAAIPPSFYWAVGFVILANVGTIVTVLIMSGRVIWWASALNTRVETVETKLDDHQAAIRTLEHVYRT